MKVGIFGDSFGDDTHRLDPSALSWIECIRQHGHNVDNFCKAGTNLWYSYKLFLQNHIAYDRIIFLVTWPGRVEINEKNMLTALGRHWTVNNIFTAYENTKDADKKQQLTFLKEYVINIYDEEKEAMLHSAILDEIKRIRNDSILYPCHSTSISNTDDLPLWDITEFEHSTMSGDNRYSVYKSRGFIDARCCHMTTPNHKIVSNMFIDRINGKQSKLTKNNLIPATGPFESYMKNADW